MTTAFLHGAEVVDMDGAPRPVATVSTAVIGLIGTAPNSQPEVKASLTTGTVGANNGLTYTSKLTGVLGNQLNVQLVDPKANNAALSVVVSGQSVTVNLATGAGGAITTTGTQLATALGASTAASALMTVAATGASTGAGTVAATARQYFSGGINEAFPLDTPVLIYGSRVDAAKLGALGTLPDAIDSILDQAGALIVVVRVAAGANDAATVTNIIGGVDGVTGQYKGMQAFLGAESVTGVRPRILIAPGFTGARSNGGPNTVVSALVPIADRLRAMIYADGPSTTDADSFLYATDFGSKRVYMIDPNVSKTDANGSLYFAPTSAHAAGVRCKVDNTSGFWNSISNQEVFGISGTARPIDFTLGDPNCRANILNANNVATVIRQNGFRIWGNRTLSSDPKWAFECVVRTNDIIADSIQRAAMEAVDKGITKGFFDYVTEEVNAYLRTLKSLGAILGGSCWYDPALNTPTELAQGHVYFDYDFTAPAPAEHIQFRSHLVNDYYKNIFTN
jgi:phage tail sheath protein FI